jgi:hypothetical protein
LGRPVVPEVKKNQHGSSRPTVAMGTVCRPKRATRSSKSSVTEGSPMPIEMTKRRSGHWARQAPT